MLDELLDMFNRDRRDEGDRPRRRGLRGILDRFVADHDDEAARHRHRRDVDDDAPHGSRRRDRDAFDFDD